MNTTDRGDRDLMLAHLDASRHHLETAPIDDCAIELVTQGLDLVAPAERVRVVAAALEQLDEP